jgi:hypothetical protein
MGEESYFRFVDMHNREPLLSFMPTLREFAEKLKRGRPITLITTNEEGMNYQIFNDNGAYKLDIVGGQ